LLLIKKWPYPYQSPDQVPDPHFQQPSPSSCPLGMSLVSKDLSWQPPPSETQNSLSYFLPSISSAQPLGGTGSGTSSGTGTIGWLRLVQLQQLHLQLPLFLLRFLLLLRLSK